MIEMRSYVYVMGRKDGPVKVGISTNPQSRLNGIQTGCPFRIKILHLEPMHDRAHAIWHEENFHAVYSQDRLIGEWFNIDAELAIEGITTALEIEHHFETRI